MKMMSLIQNKKTIISFEFFPPKTDEGISNLMDTIASLKELNPSFVSMTYGAGGSTREKTISLVSKIKNDIGIETVAHLTCVGHTRTELLSILTELKDNNINCVLALRGDPPKGATSFEAVKDGFQHADELVRLIKVNTDFNIGVAGYPEKHVESLSMEEDIKHLVDKVSAGADFVVTQLFFDNSRYFQFLEAVRAKGLVVPVIPGIIPITDFEQIKKFTSMCGATIPQSLYDALEAASSDPKEVGRLGVEFATKQCADLIKGGAPGVHFYTLNKSFASREIFGRLKAMGLVE